MSVHFPGLLQTLKSGRVKLDLLTQTSTLSDKTSLKQQIHLFGKGFILYNGLMVVYNTYQCQATCNKTGMSTILVNR
jgi:hypothetical protein